MAHGHKMLNASLSDVVRLAAFETPRVSHRRKSGWIKRVNFHLDPTDPYFPSDVLQQPRFDRLLFLSTVPMLFDVLQSTVLNSRGVPYPTLRRGKLSSNNGRVMTWPNQCSMPLEAIDPNYKLSIPKQVDCCDTSGNIADVDDDESSHVIQRSKSFLRDVR
jgi:hypothetical protein